MPIKRTLWRATKLEMIPDNHQTDAFFTEYIEQFLSENKAARSLNSDLSDCGVGLMPLVIIAQYELLMLTHALKTFFVLVFPRIKPWAFLNSITGGPRFIESQATQVCL